MLLNNIEEAALLIRKRDTLLTVLAKAEIWERSGHFEFTEDCGSHPDRISITCFPELQEKMLDNIRDEVKLIEERLKKL